MATNLDDATERIGRLTLGNDTETEITVCTWNIMGKGNAEDRKKVTTTTFKHPFRADGTCLGQSDIICIQEMKFNPQNVIAKKYLPFVEYGAVQSQEPGSNTYNGVFYNKDKFNQASIECLHKAYTLMEYKRECYDTIKQRGYVEIDKAVKGRLTEWGESDEKRAMCKEVLEECKAARSLQGFYHNIARYCVPNEVVTRHPGNLLNRRMAVCFLRMQNYYVVAVSIHNYSKKEASINFAGLFFDFVSKLQYIKLFQENHHMIVIAGDFNFDISTHQDPFLLQHTRNFVIPHYDVKPLRLHVCRNGISKIDFFVVSKQLESKVKEVQAHNLQIPMDVRQRIGEKIEDQKKITNHNPLSTTIKVTYSHRGMQQPALSVTGGSGQGAPPTSSVGGGAANHYQSLPPSSSYQSYPPTASIGAGGGYYQGTPPTSSVGGGAANHYQPLPPSSSYQSYPPTSSVGAGGGYYQGAPSTSSVGAGAANHYQPPPPSSSYQSYPPTSSIRAGGGYYQGAPSTSSVGAGAANHYQPPPPSSSYQSYPPTSSIRAGGGYYQGAPPTSSVGAGAANHYQPHHLTPLYQSYPPPAMSSVSMVAHNERHLMEPLRGVNPEWSTLVPVSCCS